MKTIQNLILVAFATLTLLNTKSLAGGVSDGGGGTTQPDQADPEWIVRTSLNDAAPAIITWLNQEEANFSRLSVSEKLKSPYNKIFQSQKSVYDVIRQTSIELRMSEPCYDANGTPKDGSIFAREPHMICISPFSMTTKLNEYNYQSETAALIFHEISHFMGTSEVEAERLQREAMWAFNKFEMLDLIVNINLLSGGTLGDGIHETMMGMSSWVQFPQQLRRSDIELFEQKLLTLRDYKLHMGSSLSGPAMLRPQKYELFTPQFVRLYVVQDYLCAQDSTEDALVRKDCRERLQKAFQTDNIISARTYEERTAGRSFVGPEWDQVTIQKPTRPTDIANILSQIRDYLIDIRQDVLLLKKFSFTGYRKN